MDKFMQIVSAGVCGVTGFLFGGLDGLLYALLAFMVIDYITGVIGAIYFKRLSSDVGFKGILKKFLILAVVAVAHILDGIIFEESTVLRSAAIGFYIANEGISVLENIAGLGVKLPKKIVSVLEQLKSENSEEDDKDK